LTERAMNIALWPATLGYWMETMMAAVFPSDVIERTREFFTKYVVGAGAVPAIRIGAQPYGILPATALSRMHRTLLDILGLPSGSVEWTQRYAESLQTAANRLNFLGLGGQLAAYLFAERRRARDLLRGFGFLSDPLPPILDKLFSGGDNLLKGGVVDDKPLSETERIRPYTTDGRNYIQWVIDAANTSIDALYRQEGFKDDKTPAALLYLFLRHALQLGYHDVSVRLHENVGIFTHEMAIAARAERPFLHVGATQAPSESRYRTLFATEPAITGTANQTV